MSDDKHAQPDAFALMRAAREGNASRIASIMQRRQRNNQDTARDDNFPLEPTAKGWTPLHEACRRGHVRAVQELLRHGWWSHVPSEGFGRTAFMVACENNQEAVVQLLLERGADPNQTVDFSGDTALHRVCLGTYNLGLAQRLLDAGADIHRVNKHRDTVLRAIGDTTSSVRYDLDLLLKRQCPPTMLGILAQEFALEPSERSFLVNLARLAQSPEATNFPDATNLSLVAMLQKTATIGGRRTTMVDFVKQYFGRTEADAFFRICARAFLCQALVCPAQRLRTAASLGDVEEFRTAMAHFQKQWGEEEEMDVNQAAANDDGLTPLHCACLYGKVQIVAQLLDHKANLWAETKSGHTPLGLAVRAEHLDVVQEILRRLLRC